MAQSETIGGATLETLTPQEVKDRFDRNEIVIIDVRTPAEFAFEHIAGAMLYPMSSFDPAKLPGQTEKAIVFHCGSGIRSKRVAQACASVGMTKLAHMEGGFGAWKSAGLPYLAVDPATGSMVSKP
ncbi:rhodanese-like domain-containing protein [Amorphus sp. 3PC139-8]|uniref:rhodanese-like domain-containing protein n=1 Tax=Amorphus sp. 3PC139-8 TaxID=2735676 RepID=UPI00345C7C74